MAGVEVGNRAEVLFGLTGNAVKKLRERKGLSEYQEELLEKFDEAIASGSGLIVMSTPRGYRSDSPLAVVGLGHPDKPSEPGLLLTALSSTVAVDYLNQARIRTSSLAQITHRLSSGKDQKIITRGSVGGETFEIQYGSSTPEVEKFDPARQVVFDLAELAPKQ